MKKVLVCPLDWGLGHATRCIPVIWELEKRGAEVIIGASGPSMELLRQEFPAKRFFELPAYRPEYPVGGGMVPKMMMQLPRFIGVISAEHRKVEQIVHEERVDAVISDNRYGCWSAKARSIFLTHQIKVPMPTAFGWLSPLVNSFSRRSIRKFSEVWVPDQPRSGLTESFVEGGGVNLRYIGWLSRFAKRRGVPRKYEIVALVSGPEPQRSILEKNLTAELLGLGLKAMMVSGEPHRPYRNTEGCVEKVNHLNAHDLEELLLSADIVISRSGYSTIMDLISLGKKAIFVPTPGQPEQLYLAGYLDKQQVAVEMQANDHLKTALEKSIDYKGFGVFERDFELLPKALDTLFL